MQTKLQELTEKIYREGVEKAREEAEKITTEAQEQADALLVKAKKDADELIKKAEKDAEALKKNTFNELQLTSRQLLSDLRQKVVNLVELKTIKPTINEVFADSSFTSDMVLAMIKNWQPGSNEDINLTVLLPENNQKEFENLFMKKAEQLLQKGLEVKFSDKIKGGMKIGPKDGGYMISFTDEDFENLFRSYLRPKLIELLYEQKD